MKEKIKLKKIRTIVKNKKYIAMNRKMKENKKYVDLFRQENESTLV